MFIIDSAVLDCWSPEVKLMHNKCWNVLCCVDDGVKVLVTLQDSFKDAWKGSSDLLRTAAILVYKAEFDFPNDWQMVLSVNSMAFCYFMLSFGY